MCATLGTPLVPSSCTYVDAAPFRLVLMDGSVNPLVTPSFRRHLCCAFNLFASPLDAVCVRILHLLCRVPLSCRSSVDQAETCILYAIVLLPLQSTLEARLIRGTTEASTFAGVPLLIVTF